MTPHKLPPRSNPCMFLGYHSNHKGYKCLSLDTNEIIISRHMMFNETIFPFGSMTLNVTPSYIFLDHVDLTTPLSYNNTFDLPIDGGSPLKTPSHFVDPTCPFTNSPNTSSH